MAANDTPPRFFKVYISQFSSDSMLIPISYYDELPSILPKTAILQGTGGCVWNVEMKKKRDEVYFGQGWPKFVADNSLSDGDFLTFVYDGYRIFEVSIYGLHTCKETRAVTEVEDVEEDRIWSVSSKETDTCSESEMAITIPRSKNKGKSKVEVVEESDDEEDSVYTDTDTDTCSEFKLAKAIPRSRNKGKKKEKVVESLNEENEPPKQKREREMLTVDLLMDDPKNVYPVVLNERREQDKLVHAQLVQDYCLKFHDYIYYIDNHKDGKLRAQTAKWKDQRVCIKGWIRICERNQLRKGDGILCELLRKRGLVYAIKIHIIREKDL